MTRKKWKKHQCRYVQRKTREASLTRNKSPTAEFESRIAFPPVPVNRPRIALPVKAPELDVAVTSNRLGPAMVEVTETAPTPMFTSPTATMSPAVTVNPGAKTVNPPVIVTPGPAGMEAFPRFVTFNHCKDSHQSQNSHGEKKFRDTL
jgi:hypothetical protein